MKDTTPEWETEFEGLYNYSETTPYNAEFEPTMAKGYQQDKDALKSFITEQLRLAKEQENRAWLEGRRCEECGKEKPAQEFWSTCEECD